MSLEGQKLGQYRLLRLLGSGGMGEVYLAEDPRIAQQVAIKVIRSEGVTYPESENAKDAVRLFEREAKAIARLDHPNILPLHAYGEETVGETPLTYLVMPYRKEGTLANWLRLRGAKALLTPVEVAPLVQQAADALQHAHDQHIIHQDIKPTNFLVRLRRDKQSHPDLLLADFGIAKLTNATASASQGVRGTPTYMAPEQWAGHPVPASDQYALAIMVYELLVGRPPFQGGQQQVMFQHSFTPPPTPSTLNPHLPPALDVVLLRALSKQPEERFPDVSAFAQAFQEAVQSGGELQKPSVADAQEPTVHSNIPTVPEPSMLAPPLRDNVPTPTVLAANMPPTTEITSPPAREPLFMAEMPNTPPPLPFRPNTLSAEKPAKLSASRRFILLGMVGLVIVALIGGVGWFAAYHAAQTGGVTAHKATPTASAAAHHTTPARNITEFALPTSKSTPASITTGPDSTLWFTEYEGNKIGRITLGGTITEFPLPTPYSYPGGITTGPDGNLWFTESESNKIGRITTTGIITEFPLPKSRSSPFGITAGSDGNLWFTEYEGNKIGRITSGGTITEFPLPTYSITPDEITTGSDGNLWFTEFYVTQSINWPPKKA